MRRVDEARARLSRAVLDERRTLPSVAELRKQWPSMALTERRTVMQEVIECAFVTQGPRAPEKRVLVYLRGQAPPDLPPYRPPRGLTTRPFDPAECPAPVRLRPADDWDSARLAAILAPFLNGWRRWPSFPEFQEAGLAIAYAQVARHGGPRRWAQLTGLPYKRRSGNEWDDDRIHRELAAYLEGRDRWPTTQEFRYEGHTSLRNAIAFSGGPERWAPEMGVALPSRRGQPMRWGSYQRLKEEVADFAAGRVEYPTHSEFIEAGLEGLYHAIVRSGTRDRIARELRLLVPPNRKLVRADRWTEPRVVEALDAFLKGRATWPSKAEFARAGLGGLDWRIRRTQTREAWAGRYGLRIVFSERGGVANSRRREIQKMRVPGVPG
jgi:hypothetical protein